MKKFAFRLEAVRRLREQEEQVVQTEFAGALRERATLQGELDASRKAEDAIYDYLHTSHLTGAELEHVSQYGALHRRRILDARIMLQQCDQRIERVRAKLTAARAKREALDKLCEQERAEHRQRWLAEEIRELDEIASQRAQRPGVRLLNADLDGLTERRGAVA